MSFVSPKIAKPMFSAELQQGYFGDLAAPTFLTVGYVGKVDWQ